MKLNYPFTIKQLLAIASNFKIKVHTTLNNCVRNQNKKIKMKQYAFTTSDKCD